MTIKELGDSFFDEKMEKVIDDFPYMSFVILSVILEFIAKCRLSDFDADTRGKTKNYFTDAINDIEALRKYRSLSDCNCDLYTSLRCPMVHSCTPKDDIILSPDKNDLENKTIGAKELYGDLRLAWKEVLDDKKDGLNKEIIIVTGVLSGSTTNTSMRYKESIDSD